jgi:alpha-mannosidase
VVARADHPCDATLPPGAHSFLRLEGPALLSAYYRGEDAEHAYMRLYESAGQGGEATLTFDWLPSSAQAVDLLGQPVGVPVRIEKRQVSVTLRPWQIVTLRVSRG